jgi:L-fuconate dehydratase
MFDFVAVSANRDGRMIEYVDHLHDHFVTPTIIREGNYVAPEAPGAGTEMIAESRTAHRWVPDNAHA